MAQLTTSLYRNLSRVELGIALLIFSIIVVVFMRYVHRVEVAAEEALINTAVQDMRSRLMSYRTELIGSRRSGAAQTLDSVARYLGRGNTRFVTREVELDWSNVSPGEWVFVRETRTFLYRTITEESIAGSYGTPPRVAIQLVSETADTPKEQQRVSIHGLTLKRVGSGQ